MDAARRSSRLLGPRLAGNRDFALLWSAASISILGSSISQLALPTVAILQLHASVAVVGALTLVGWLPELVLSAVHGVVADRVRKRRMLVLCDVVDAFAVGSIPVAAAFGRLGLVQLFLAQAVRAVAGNLGDVTFFSFLPTLVRHEALVDANARLETSVQTARPGRAWTGRAAHPVDRRGAHPGLRRRLLRPLRGADARHPQPGLPARAAADGGASPASFLADLRTGVGFVFGDHRLRRLALASSLSNLGSAIGMAPVGAAVGAALGSTVGLVPTLVVAGVVTMSAALPLVDRGLRVAERAPSAA